DQARPPPAGSAGGRTAFCPRGLGLGVQADARVLCQVRAEPARPVPRRGGRRAGAVHGQERGDQPGGH
ncbi:unnamed protein product, partial [Prorocentrum cordatum]